MTDGPPVKVEVESAWRDTKFDMRSSKNGGTKIGKLWPTATFIKYKDTPIDGIDEGDIQQGNSLGNCWFLAALASLADGNRDGKPYKPRIHALNHVLQMDYNSDPRTMKEGRFTFQFYRLGKWETVDVDNILPLRKVFKLMLAAQAIIGQSFLGASSICSDRHKASINLKTHLSRRSRKTDDDEWWVCLVEKAYAKFNGSYDNIEGGYTSWALTELTGGIAIEMDRMTMRFGFIFYSDSINCFKNWLV